MEIHYHQTPLTWWLDKLNKRFGLPDYKELIILFWYMSSWKTEFSYFVARKNAEKWNPVCIISLELPEYEMKLRIARKKAGVSKYDFQTWRYNETQKDIMNKAFKEIDDIKNLAIISIDDKQLWTIENTIRSYYDSWYRFFIIDNLDKIAPDRNEDENHRYQRITSTLQDLKNESNLCLMLIHHAKKPDWKWTYNRAGMSGMRWSQKIMDNATQVFEIYRDLDPESWEKDAVEIIQLKDTFEGNNGSVEIYFFRWNYYDERIQSF